MVIIYRLLVKVSKFSKQFYAELIDSMEATETQILPIMFNVVVSKAYLTKYPLLYLRRDHAELILHLTSYIFTDCFEPSISIRTNDSNTNTS